MHLNFSVIPKTETDRKHKLLLKFTEVLKLSKQLVRMIEFQLYNFYIILYLFNFVYILWMAWKLLFFFKVNNFFSLNFHFWEYCYMPVLYLLRHIKMPKMGIDMCKPWPFLKSAASAALLKSILTSQKV